MSDGEKTNTPLKALASQSNHPESPTTARPLDFDDEPQESGVIPMQTPSAPNLSSTGGNEGAPPKPPRPLSPMQQAEINLKEAFPSIDASVIKAVLVASDGNVERSFHALLGMSDPDAQVELPPMMPPRPPRKDSPTQRQLEADEMYARQLAEHYSGTGQRHRGPNSAWDHEPRLPRPHRETGLKPNELYDDREHNFFEDDLPIIKENIRKGFLETQTKVNTWVQSFKKKLEGEDDEDEYGNTPPRPAQGYAQGCGEPQTYRTRRSGEARRSGDRERYDADPQVLGDDFSALELRDTEAQPPRSSRPLANPDLFKSSSPSPDRRKVSFQEGPPDEIHGAYGPRAASDRNRQPPSTGGNNKSSKWQPLSAVEPSPVGDNDPFSLGDSDDERELRSNNKDLKPDEAERVKEATAEAMAGDIGGDSAKAGSNNASKPAGGT
ncbi:CUE domain-containing protein [Blastomyces dermatitidis ATCC 18188]|uniref:CUE domain-containing protein n=1 Tax=Ajellomyces dermatitidis (strain ATCC 18188 / CBS 674.68) TaxID=653446 RepID=F2T8W0_AJEDA|nr:CUE domain-containing protein [Blastomyces dermatitidis ATCC 18188]